MLTVKYQEKRQGSQEELFSNEKVILGKKMWQWGNISLLQRANKKCNLLHMGKSRQKENLQKCLIKYIGNFVHINENVRSSLTVRNENGLFEITFYISEDNIYSTRV